MNYFHLSVVLGWVHLDFLDETVDFEYLLGLGQGFGVAVEEMEIIHYKQFRLLLRLHYFTRRLYQCLLFLRLSLLEVKT